MARIRAVVTMPYTTALPEDVVVNTFHFLTGNSPASPGELTDIMAILRNAYNADLAGAGSSVAAALSNLVSRAANAATVECFDLADAEPRLAVSSLAWTVDASSGATASPSEVALCMSFQAAPISGVPQARRRGRVFLGPFNGNVLSLTTPGRPSAALIASVVGMGGQLLADSITEDVPWCVYSRVGDAMAAVTDGWCDNAWDTQRRRGVAASARSIFS